MKASFLPVLLLLVASSSIAQLPVTEKEAVAYAKAWTSRYSILHFHRRVSRIGSKMARHT
jgi:hypothetical protein